MKNKTHLQSILPCRNNVYKSFSFTVPIRLKTKTYTLKLFT